MQRGDDFFGDCSVEIEDDENRPLLRRTRKQENQIPGDLAEKPDEDEDDIKDLLRDLVKEMKLERMGRTRLPAALSELQQVAEINTILDVKTEIDNPEAVKTLRTQSGRLVQCALVIALIGVNSYEALFKEKNSNLRKSSDQTIGISDTSTSVGQALVGVLIGVLMIVLGKWRKFFIHSGDYVRQFIAMTMQYAPVGIIFSISQLLVLKIFQILTPDRQKVIDQARLLVVTMVSYVMLKKRPSGTMWVLLIVITLCALNYNVIKEFETGGSRKSTNPDTIFAYLLCLVNIVITCVATVYSEKVMKSQKTMPFFAQKFYVEISGFCCSLTYAYYSDFHRTPNKLTLFHRDFIFHGMNWNVFVILFFLTFCTKAWFTGLVAKRLDSIVSRMCNVAVIGYLYIFQKVHSCKPSDRIEFIPKIVAKFSIFISRVCRVFGCDVPEWQEGPVEKSIEYVQETDFFCIGGLWSETNGLSWAGMISCLLIVFALVSYAGALRNQRRIQVLEAQKDLAGEVAAKS